MFNRQQELDNALHQEIFRQAQVVYTDKIDNLIERGANVNSRDQHGNTPLMKAAWIGDFVRVKELIHLGANLDLQNNFGETALMLICRIPAGNYILKAATTKIVKLFIDTGTNIHIRDQQGRTALDLVYNAEGRIFIDKKKFEILKTEWLALQPENNIILKNHNEYKNDIRTLFYELDKANLLNDKYRNVINSYPDIAKDLTPILKNSYFSKQKKLDRVIKENMEKCEQIKLQLLLPVSSANCAIRFFSEVKKPEANSMGFEKSSLNPLFQSPKVRLH